MRTIKRFTPDILDRYKDLGRGTGTYKTYIPWHRVSRGDPASWGRSHLLYWHDRHIELLSDKEFIATFFASRLLFLSPKNDLREQFPLSLEEAPHELADYDVQFRANRFPGTLEIADNLNIKHPMTHGDGRSAPWVMTTDFLIMLQTNSGARSLLAIAIKDKVTITKRVKQLLNIEKAYWQYRGVLWIFITPNEYHPLVANTLQRTWPWALENPVPEAHLNAAETAIHRYQTYSLTHLQNQLSKQLGDLSQAQNAIWQAVWSGQVPVDLRRGWRPHIPLRIISQEEFDQLNPVLMRRSAWT